MAFLWQKTHWPHIWILPTLILPSNLNTALKFEHCPQVWILPPPSLNIAIKFEDSPQVWILSSLPTVSFCPLLPSFKYCPQDWMLPSSLNITPTLALMFEYCPPPPSSFEYCSQVWKLPPNMDIPLSPHPASFWLLPTNLNTVLGLNTASKF